MSGPANLETPVILMAEDDPDDRLLMEEAVAEAGLGVAMRYVADGIELMDHLDRIKAGHANGQDSLPDLILLDLNMPRMDGREVLERIKAGSDFQHIPVVVLTTTRRPEDQLSARVLGAADFLVKPASFEGLVALVCSLPEYWRRSKAPDPDSGPTSPRIGDPNNDGTGVLANGSRRARRQYHGRRRRSGRSPSDQRGAPRSAS